MIEVYLPRSSLINQITRGHARFVLLTDELRAGLGPYTPSALHEAPGSRLRAVARTHEKDIVTDKGRPSPHTCISCRALVREAHTYVEAASLAYCYRCCYCRLALARRPAFTKQAYRYYCSSLKTFYLPEAPNRQTKL